MTTFKYPKIQTLWKRDEKTHKIIEGDYNKKEFEVIDSWSATEKIDGMNIRIEYETKTDPASAWQEVILSFKGREEETDKDIPKPLLEFLQKTFTVKKKWEIFPDSNHIILFGEGYGSNIQAAGKKYRDDVSFILFDVYIDGWWLERENVRDIANKFNIDIVPALGIMTKKEIIQRVKIGIPSLIANQSMDMEGIVARSNPMMLFRDGKPIIWKLKSKDYR